MQVTGKDADDPVMVHKEYGVPMARLYILHIFFINIKPLRGYRTVFI